MAELTPEALKHLDNLEREFRAGNIRGAKKLRDAVRVLSKHGRLDPGPQKAFGSHFLNDLFLSWGPELMGAAAAAGHRPSADSPLNPDEMRQAVADRVRASLAQSSEDYPGPATAGRVTGGMASVFAPVGGTLAAMGRSARMLPRAVAGGTVGAVEEGIRGAGHGGPDNRLSGAAVGAGIGATAGAAGGALIPPAAKWLYHGLGDRIKRSALGQFVRGVRGMEPNNPTVDHLAREMRLSGATPEDASRALKERGSGAMLADVPEFQPGMRGVVQDSPTAGNIIMDALTRRRGQETPAVVNAQMQALSGKAPELGAPLNDITSSRQPEPALAQIRKREIDAQFNPTGGTITTEALNDPKNIGLMERRDDELLSETYSRLEQGAQKLGDVRTSREYARLYGAALNDEKALHNRVIREAREAGVTAEPVLNEQFTIFNRQARDAAQSGNMVRAAALRRQAQELQLASYGIDQNRLLELQGERVSNTLDEMAKKLGADDVPGVGDLQEGELASQMWRRLADKAREDGKPSIAQEYVRRASSARERELAAMRSWVRQNQDSLIRNKRNIESTGARHQELTDKLQQAQAQYNEAVNQGNQRQADYLLDRVNELRGQTRTGAFRTHSGTQFIRPSSPEGGNIADPFENEMYELLSLYGVSEHSLDPKMWTMQGNDFIQPLVERGGGTRGPGFTVEQLRSMGVPDKHPLMREALDTPDNSRTVSIVGADHPLVRDRRAGETPTQFYARMVHESALKDFDRLSGKAGPSGSPSHPDPKLLEEMFETETYLKDAKAGRISGITGEDIKDIENSLAAMKAEVATMRAINPEQLAKMEELAKIEHHLRRVDKGKSRESPNVLEQLNQKANQLRAEIDLGPSVGHPPGSFGRDRAPRSPVAVALSQAGRMGLLAAEVPDLTRAAGTFKGFGGAPWEEVARSIADKVAKPQHRGRVRNMLLEEFKSSGNQMYQGFSFSAFPESGLASAQKTEDALRYQMANEAAERAQLEGEEISGDLTAAIENHGRLLNEARAAVNAGDQAKGLDLAKKARAQLTAAFPVSDGDLAARWVGELDKFKKTHERIAAGWNPREEMLGAAREVSTDRLQRMQDRAARVKGQTADRLAQARAMPEPTQALPAQPIQEDVYAAPEFQPSGSASTPAEQLEERLRHRRDVEIPGAAGVMLREAQARGGAPIQINANALFKGIEDLRLRADPAVEAVGNVRNLLQGASGPEFVPSASIDSALNLVSRWRQNLGRSNYHSGKAMDAAGRVSEVQSALEAARVGARGEKANPSATLNALHRVIGEADPDRLTSSVGSEAELYAQIRKGLEESTQRAPVQAESVHNLSLRLADKARDLANKGDFKAYRSVNDLRRQANSLLTEAMPQYKSIADAYDELLEVDEALSLGRILFKDSDTMKKLNNADLRAKLSGKPDQWLEAFRAGARESLEVAQGFSPNNAKRLADLFRRTGNEARMSMVRGFDSDAFLRAAENTRAFENTFVEASQGLKARQAAAGRVAREGSQVAPRSGERRSGILSFMRDVSDDVRLARQAKTPWAQKIGTSLGDLYTMRGAQQQQYLLPALIEAKRRGTAAPIPRLLYGAAMRLPSGASAEAQWHFNPSSTKYTGL